MRTAAAMLLTIGWIGGAMAQPLTDAGVRAAIIRQSLAAYPGPCPCPYNVMRNGRRCGSRSAYSRPGGYSPTCFESDITPAMIDRYRAGRGN
jgi:hypothetical protein